jgi:hypothetical protein
MLIELRPLDRPAIRFKNPANIKGLAKKFACRLNCVITRLCRARLRQSTRLSCEFRDMIASMELPDDQDA